MPNPLRVLSDLLKEVASFPQLLPMTWDSFGEQCEKRQRPGDKKGSENTGLLHPAGVERKAAGAC